MSELTNTKNDAYNSRWHLLSTASAIVLLACMGAQRAEAASDDADRPTIWIDLGGQLERMASGRETFSPSFLNSFNGLGFEPVLPVQRPSRYAYGAEGKISFAPHHSEWVLSAAIRYGRSNGKKASSQQLPPGGFALFYTPGNPGYRVQNPPFHLNATGANTERHAILDFRVGKDVGLGLFSTKDTSELAFGVRFAQFTSSRTAGFNGVPDFIHHGTNMKYEVVYQGHHHYSASLNSKSSFDGVGPSLSWEASAAVSGKREDASIAVDWGVNASILFGRQKVGGEQNVTGEHYKTGNMLNIFQGVNINYFGVASSYSHHANIKRSRSVVVVPNVGGFAGVSFNYPSAKASFGYRVDAYFGALDSGIGVRKTADRIFYGPFAKLSIGLGG